MEPERWGASSSGADTTITEGSRPNDAMVVDYTGQNANAPSEDVTMRSAESAPLAPANLQTAAVVMSTATLTLALAAPRLPPVDEENHHQIQHSDHTHSPLQLLLQHRLQPH